MKKSLVVIFLVIILLGVFVGAADTGVSGDLQGAGADAKNLSLTFGLKANQVLTNDMQIPGWLKTISIFIFGIGENNLSLEQMVTVICLWIITLIMVLSIMEFVPIFKDKAIRIVAGIAISMLMGLSGGLNEVYQFFFNMTSMISFLEKYPILRFISILILLSILFVAINTLLLKVKRKVELVKAEEIGENLAQGEAAAKVQYEGMKRLAGK